MKKLVTFLAVALVSICVSVGVFAQSPQTMSYQAVVRNNSNALVASTTIGMQISILQKSSTGDPVYIEKHSTTTNANGLATIEIGGGTPVSGRFETIDWSSGPYFLKTETDPTGGSSYSMSGTSKLLSVPYALYAEKSGKSGSVDPWLTEGNSLTTVGTNFLGTIDSQPLMFKVYNTEAGYIDWDYNKANTGFGFRTLFSNTIGHSNTANGYQALQSNTTGVQNSAIGKLALSANTEGNNNIALGSEALSFNTSGSFNVAAGTSTMRYNTAGNYNTASGIWSLYNNNKGSYNSAYGTSALVSNVDGINNTAIGYNADVLTGSLKNATAIGNGAKANTSNEVRIGNKDVSSLYFGTANNLAVTTDSVPNMFYDRTTGQILRSTATTTSTGGSDDWKLAGNSGTIDNGTYFIGTTDDVPLNFKVNNILAGRIDHQLGNVLFGSEAGINTTGQDNTAIGDKALTSNTTGKSNTATGKAALYTNTTGDYNTANGFQTLYSNTTGVYNTATGFSALHSNTTGNFNAAFGNHSLTSNTTGIENSAFGSSLVMNTTGYDNSGFGYSSLASNTTGSGNSAFGAQALTNNITGVSNSAFGHTALSQSNAASGNSAFGYRSLGSNTTGNSNAAFGSSSLYHNIIGNYNTAVGPEALLFNTSGNNNASFGTFSLHSNTTGSNNSAFGFQAGINLTTETNLTLIGANAGINASGYNNATAIGYNAIITGSNTIKLGDNNIINVKTAGTYTAGTVTYPNTLGNAGDVLTLPASGGNAYWSAPATGGSTTHWDILGNAGTTAGLNFIGTTDSQPLMFKVNSVKSGYIDYDNTKANTFLGFQTGINNTGYSNTAMGYGAFVINVAGHQNTAFGFRSLYSNTTGNGNAANGMSSLFSNTTGSLNTATGTNALFANSTGLYNTANGNMSLANTSASDGNTALGYSSGDNNVNNGNNNTFIGNSAAANASGFDNATALGFNALVAGSNNMILGNNTVNVGIGLSGISPGPANKLEINASNGSGLRFRGLTTTAAPVTNPGTGVLTVDSNGDVIYATAGSTGSSVHTIGEVYGGGTVFYVCDNGQHGLIAALTDQSTSMRWDNGVSRITGTTGDGLFAGAMNTTMIVATQIGDNQAGDFAAKVCADYSVTTSMYGDWYLPSKYELYLLYTQRNVVGGFDQAYYWCSSEVSAQFGNVLGFDNNTWSVADKSETYHVRAVRAF